MNRDQRAQIAQETVQILEQGRYQSLGGKMVAIGEQLAAACAATRLYHPDDYEQLLAQLEGLPGHATTTVAVSSQTTLAAAQALVAMHPTLACLNFASAKNPGGGFLSGSQAQEESLARSSGLYATLQTQLAFYSYHRQLKTALYSDHAIFSPQVPVFRDDGGRLLEQPSLVSFITAAAPNAGAVRNNEPGNVVRIRPTLEQRTRVVLAIGAVQGCAALVLGAWGCGVFQNDPLEVAEVFAAVLREPPFAQRFRHIEFAVYDTSRDQAVLRAFEDVF